MLEVTIDTTGPTRELFTYSAGDAIIDRDGDVVVLLDGNNGDTLIGVCFGPPEEPYELPFCLNEGWFEAEKDTKFAPYTGVISLTFSDEVEF